jgi:hypothetical protein
VVFEGLLSFDMNNKLIQFVAHDADSDADIDIDTASDGERDDVSEMFNRGQKVLESEKGGREVEGVGEKSTEYDKGAGHSAGGGGTVSSTVCVKGDLHRAGAGAVGAEWLQLYSMVLSSALSTGEVRIVSYSVLQYNIIQCTALQEQ